MLRGAMPEKQQDNPTPRLPAVADRMEDERRFPPPSVYCAPDGDSWIVEPPQHLAPHEDKVAFRGAQAQYRALMYAHEKFGNARFFPYGTVQNLGVIR